MNKETDSEGHIIGIRHEWHDIFGEAEGEYSWMEGPGYPERNGHSTKDQGVRRGNTGKWKKHGDHLSLMRT